MAVPEQTPYIEHTGNGVTTSFSLGFQCESKDHLIVLVDEIEPPIATWSLNNGNVVFTTAPAAGKKITVQRNTPFGRTANYQSFNNSFRPQTVNVDFDRIWWKLQELGVADWLMKLYVDRLHQQQEQEINDLKDYVDDRDDELRAYLMEEIRKQGVALDQLDDYYNYLMQRLAQIAVDKGWDAAFVVDASGKNQQEINTTLLFINAETLTPEMFGAVGDGVTDDTQALIDMLKSCTDMPTGSGINLNTIISVRHGTLSNYKKVRLTGLYRHTKPIHIPPNCWIEQPLTGSFSKNVGTIGLYYDPVPSEYDTYAVGFFLYKKDLDGTYSLDTSPYTLPSGSQFDNNTWVMTGNRVLLDNLSITTKPNVTLGFRAVGFSGSCFRYINVGTNDGSSSRIPKVAVLTNGGWNSVFEKPTTLSSVQGWVNWGSNGGMVVNQPYINRGYNATPLDRIVPIYKPTDFTETGAIGIVNRGDAYWNQPITEHWYYNYVVENSYLRCNHPHVEGTGTKNCFYFVGTAAHADIVFKQVTTVNTALEKASLIYLKNCDIQNSIVLRGMDLGASPLVYGENSSACVYVKLARSHWFIQTRKWGDLNLIAHIENYVDKVIYVDPINGNDEAVGLRNTNALKTLAKVKRLAEIANIREVNLVSAYTHTNYVTLHKDVIFSGAELIVSSGALEFSDRNLDVHFNNTKLTMPTNVSIQVKGVSYGSFSFTCELANQMALINCQNNANLTVNVTNNTITDKVFVSCAANYKAYVDLNIKTTSTLTAAPVSGDVVLVNAPHMVGSSSVAAQTVPAGQRTALATMVLGGIRLGDNVLLSYTANLSGLDLKGYVSSNNTVSYYFENRTNSAVSLASGNVNAKRV